MRKEGEDMSFNFIVVFCFCKSHISIACFFTSLKKYVSRRLLPLVPHDATSILILKVSALFLVSLIQYVTSSRVDCICIPPGLGPPLLSSLFCSVSIRLSSKLSTSFRYFSYLHVYWIILYSLSSNFCLDMAYGHFIHFISLCDSCMMGNDIIFRKVPLFHRYPVFFQMSMFTAFT